MKPRICLIEDDPIMGEAIVERLDMEGYTCDWFQRGRDALAGLLHKGYCGGTWDQSQEPLGKNAQTRHPRIYGRIRKIFVNPYWHYPLATDGVEQQLCESAISTNDSVSPLIGNPRRTHFAMPCVMFSTSV